MAASTSTWKTMVDWRSPLKHWRASIDRTGKHLTIQEPCLGQTFGTRKNANMVSKNDHIVNHRTLAGIIGVQWAIETSNNDYSAEIDAAPLTFKPGRRDCPSSPYTTEVHSFPNPNGGSAETFEYFKTTFGLSKYETVTNKMLV